jgi:N-acetyl-anhydromuramyl-L-alanine amidase AmpD
VVGESGSGKLGRKVTARSGGTLLALAIACAGLPSCGRRQAPTPPVPFDPGTEIVVCGERFDVGTPVVLWTDPIGFDAYSERCRFSDRVLPGEADSKPDESASPLRYGKRSGRVASVDDLAAVVRLVVVHYDAVGSSERCFRALHDNRGLSAHFLLDLDGTLYQTLDLRERAFHARDVNDESIGIEIANVGGMSTPKLLEAWYGMDEEGSIYNLFPPHARLGEQRRRDLVLRPRRQAPIVGTIHGSKLFQHDFTTEQYEALARLLAGIARVLPRVHLEAPRDRRGRVPAGIVSESVVAKFEGIVGHHHLDEKKFDPGPAFDWEWVLGEARRIFEEAAERR